MVSSHGIWLWRWETSLHIGWWQWNLITSVDGALGERQGWQWISHCWNYRVCISQNKSQDLWTKITSKARMFPLRGSYLFPLEPIFVGRFWVSFVIGWEILLPKKISETSPPLTKDNLPGIKFQCGKSLMCSLLGLSIATRVACRWLTKLEAEVGHRCDECVSVRAHCQWRAPMTHVCLPLWAAAARTVDLLPKSRRHAVMTLSAGFVCIPTLSYMCLDAAFTLLANSSMQLSLKMATAMPTEGCLLCSHHRRNFIRVVLAIATSIILPMHAVKPLHICWYIPSMPPSNRAPRKLSFRKPRGPCKEAPTREFPTQKNTCQTYHFLCPKISYLGDIFGLHPTQ